jgi:hypothetical protein
MSKKSGKPQSAPPIQGVPFKDLVGALVEVPLKEGKKKRGAIKKKSGK